VRTSAKYKAIRLMVRNFFSDDERGNHAALILVIAATIVSVCASVRDRKRGVGAR